MITREADYALRTILYLASVRVKSGGRVTATDLSLEMEIPYRFLRNITRRLVRAGILVSHRGRAGGLELTRPPAEISLLDVLNAVSVRSSRLNTCLGEEGVCTRESRCAIHDQLVILQATLDRQLTGITFDQLTAPS